MFFWRCFLLSNLSLKIMSMGCCLLCAEAHFVAHVAVGFMEGLGQDLRAEDKQNYSFSSDKSQSRTTLGQLLLYSQSLQLCNNILTALGLVLTYIHSFCVLSLCRFRYYLFSLGLSSGTLLHGSARPLSWHDRLKHPVDFLFLLLSHFIILPDPLLKMHFRGKLQILSINMSVFCLPNKNFNSYPQEAYTIQQQPNFQAWEFWVRVV